MLHAVEEWKYDLSCGTDPTTQNKGFVVHNIDYNNDYGYHHRESLAKITIKNMQNGIKLRIKSTASTKLEIINTVLLFLHMINIFNYLHFQTVNVFHDLSSN